VPASRDSIVFIEFRIEEVSVGHVIFCWHFVSVWIFSV